MSRYQQSGFTLVELAVAIAIIGLLMGGAIATMAAQHKLKIATETKQLLLEAQEALIGFAIAAGRLPCPTNDGSEESFASGDSAVGGVCDSDAEFLPAATLGIGPTNTEGFLVDPWGNRVRYAVTTAGTNAFTTAGNIRATMSAESADYLSIDGDEGKAVVIVIYSTGENGEKDAKTGDQSFSTTEGDDILIPLSRYTLYSRMSTARAL